jgi:hypothetical protein
VHFGGLSHRVDRLIKAPGELTGLMRVHSGGKLHSRPRRSDPSGSLGLGFVTRREDAQRPRHPRFACTRDDGVKVCSELLARQVAMRIDHLTLVPGAIS